MPEIEMRDREAFEIGDMIHSAGKIVEDAIRLEDPASKKALRDAAKALLQTAIDRMDENIGSSDADEED